MLKIHVDKKMYREATKIITEARESGKRMTYSQAVGEVYARRKNLIDPRKITKDIAKTTNDFLEKAFGKQGGFF